MSDLPLTISVISLSIRFFMILGCLSTILSSISPSSIDLIMYCIGSVFLTGLPEKPTSCIYVEREPSFRGFILSFFLSILTFLRISFCALLPAIEPRAFLVSLYSCALSDSSGNISVSLQYSLNDFMITI